MNARPNQPGYLDDDVIRGSAEGLASLGYLLKFARRDAPRFGAALTLLIGSAGLTMGSAVFLGRLIEEGLGARTFAACTPFAVAIIALEAAALLAAFVGRTLLADAASRTLLRIRESLFHYIHELPLSYYDRQPLGRTVTRMSHDVESLETFFSASLSRLVLASLTIAASLTAMVLTDIRIGAVLTAAALPAIAINYATRLQARDLNRRMARTNSAINARLAEYLNGISVIRAFGLERWTGAEFARSVETYLRSCIDTNRFYSWLRPIAEVLCQLPLLVLVWVGGSRVLSGVMPLGLFVTFLRYCQRFSGPITELSREVQAIQEAVSTAERIGAFLNAPTEESELGADGSMAAHNLRGAIEFRAVSMAYSPGEPILRELSFQIPAGATVGLAGPTGSGKTTTVSLLARLYEFQTGDILIDGASIRDFTRASLRDAIGFVSQDVIIVEGTIRENLECGRPRDEAAILAACARTGLAEVLALSGRTLESPLLDRGANVSVGERQLLALTRVLLAEPAILVLDEATANIDPALEKTVHHAVDTVMAGRTCLIIAHRLDTLRNCDTVFVFREGCIAEQGPPDVVLRHPVELPEHSLDADRANAPAASDDEAQEPRFPLPD